MKVDSKTHWQNIYHDKSPGNLSWYQKEPELSLEFIQQAGIGQNEPIIDVGGGTSMLVDFLYNKGYTNLSVLDISAKALASAQQRLGDSATEIQWYEADITEFNPPHHFSIWHDRAVFHFLTSKPEREKYVSVLQQSLRLHGQLIIAAFAKGGPTQCSGLDIVQYDALKLSTELGEEFELVDQRNEVHVTPADKEQAFQYYRFVKVSRVN